MHGTDTKSFIRTKECVYWHSPTAKLERNKIGISVLHPRQQGFEGDSQTCLSIGVDHLPTLTAFEQGIVGRTMPDLCHSTAVATPFRGVVGIDFVQDDSLIKTTTLQYLFEFAKRNSKYLSVEALAFTAESPELLDRNIGIKFECQIGDVSYDLTQPILDKTVFTVFEASKIFGGFAISFVGKRTELGTSCHNLLSLVPDVFSEVGLMQDFSIWSKNGNCKTLAVNINSENVFARLKDNIILIQIGDKMPLCGISDGCALPASKNEVLKSLVASILLDRNGKSSFGIESEFNKLKGFGFEEFGIALSSVEFDGDVGDCLAACWFSGNLTQNVQNDTVLERGVFLAG
jgi:hypothetical protein